MNLLDIRVSQKLYLKILIRLIKFINMILLIKWNKFSKKNIYRIKDDKDCI